MASLTAPAQSRAHAGHHALPRARSDTYARRRPEETVLYQTVAKAWPGFRERMEEVGGLPNFIREEFDEYLKCGRLEAGFLELECRECGHSMLVALSCKKRGFCPACMGRRMADVAVHLEKCVLPQVPIRHWICTFPWGVRAVLGYDKALAAEAVSAFVSELCRSLKRRAKQHLGLESVTDAHTGAVAALQRVDSALRLNVHLHVLGLDGVYVRDENTGALGFHALPAPSESDVEDVARRTALRMKRAFKERGRHSPWEDGGTEEASSEPLELKEPGLFACYNAAAAGVGVSGERTGKPLMRLIAGEGRAKAEQTREGGSAVAEVLGVNVHAIERVDGRDRKRIERLARYILRPPVAQERLEERADGRLELTFKNAWKDGTRGILLEPDDLLVRLCAAVPPPRMHQLRYFGVLSSHHALRSEVTPKFEVEPGMFQAEQAKGDQLLLALDDDASKASGAAEQKTEWRGRTRWGWLLRHVFRADLDTCERCGGAMRWVEAATTEEAIGRLLEKHALRPEAAPRTVPFLPRGQLPLPFS